MGFKGKRVLITGGAGFIGSNLAIRLVSEGAEVSIMDSMLPEYGGNLFNLQPIKDKVEINFSDMRDPHTVPYLIKDKDYIFNLAGQVSHTDSMTDPLTDMEINVKAQLVFLEAVRRHNPNAVVAYASTRQFYGAPQYLPVDEKHPINPPDVNGINKLAGEQYHMLYSRVFGIKATALRLTNTFGPRQLIKNARQGFIGWFINRTVTGNEIQIFGDGMQVRDFNYVDDVVEAFLISSQTPSCYGRYFNLSGDKANLKDLSTQMVLISGTGSVKLVPFPEERKKIDIGNYYGDSSLLSTTAGWRPSMPLADGLKKTIAYYMEHKSKYLDDN